MRQERVSAEAAGVEARGPVWVGEPAGAGVEATGQLVTS
jgi:hypothetical protein